ncbi:MAG: DNA-processing protein DprA [Rikenellaceae bacterium]
MIVEDIALTLTPGLNLKGAVRLLEVFSTAENIFRASHEELTHFAQLNPRVATAVVNRVAFAQAQREVEYCRKNAIEIITSRDDVYPELLRHTPDYPPALYLIGNKEALKGRCVSIVGTRRITSYGDRMTHEAVKGLAAQLPDLTIVSGLAFGVDGSAHRAALAYGATTVAVVANPLPAVTPTQHTGLADDIIKNGGAIISECHSQTKYHPSLYLDRNRIIATMSSVTIIAESPKSGGSMVTAKIADSYDRTVMAIPGRQTDKNSEGCNSLISSRVAQLYMSPEHLIRTMMWDVDAPADRVVTQPLAIALSPEQQSLLTHFGADEILDIEELGLRSKLETSTLLSLLMELELQGVLHVVRGNRVELLNVVATS